MARNPSQIRHYQRHREEILAAQRAFRATPKGQAHTRARHKREQNHANNLLRWRAMRFAARRNRVNVETGVMSFLDLNELQHPCFIWVHKGRFQREYLTAPLPSAHPICANLPMSAGD